MRRDHVWRVGALAALFLCLPRPAAADDKTPAPTIAPHGALEHEPRRPGDLVTLSLENAELGDLVRTMSEMTGKRFVVAASPKSFQATVIAPQKVTVAEAYRAFLAILAANHLTIVPQGRFEKIIDAQDAVREAPVRSPGQGGGAPEERYVTYVRRVAHVSAEQVATSVLSKLVSRDGSVIPYGDLLLVTDTGTNVDRMMRVLDEIDIARADDKVWLEPLQYAASAEVKKELDELLDSKGAGDKGDKGAPAPLAGGGGDARVVKIVAIERPNALLVVGSQAGYERLLELIRSIDVAEPNEGQMHVVMLEHADAKKLVGPINEAVAAASGGGGGAAGAGSAAGAIRALDAPVKVSAEETNNALIVSADAHDFAAVREVIRALDRPRRQVYIEAVVMDLSAKRTNELDAALHGFGDVSGALGAGSVAYGGSNPLKSILLPTDPSALQALVLGVRGPSIAVPGFLQSTLGTTSIPGLGFFLDAYAITEDADILSTPHILATDNVPADIRVLLNTSLQRNVPSYGVPSTGASGAAASSLSALSLYSAPATANYGKIGPEIKVTPHLNESDDVRLDIQETISDVASGPQGTLGTIDYLERGATTTLTVKDGHTCIIGGLVRDKVSHQATKVPLLGDIPLLGVLFRSTVDVVEKDNLVLVLTPHIIRDEDDMRRIFEQRMRERQELLDHVFVFHDTPPVGFDPARGHGLLAELRASQRDVEERRRLEAPPPTTTIASHEPHAPIDLPSGASATASATATATATGATAPQPSPPPTLQVAPPVRTLDRVER